MREIVQYENIGQGWQIHGTSARGGMRKDLEGTQKVKIFLLHIYYIYYVYIFWLYNISRSKRKRWNFWHVAFTLSTYGIGTQQIYSVPFIVYALWVLIKNFLILLYYNKLIITINVVM